MHNEMELACELYEMTGAKLANMREKFRKNGGEIPNNDIDLFDKLTHSWKSLKTTIAMMESEGDNGYSGNYNSYGSYRGGSYGNMSSRNRNRMGRYSNANGLHEMLDGLTEEQKMNVQRYIEEMGRM